MIRTAAFVLAVSVALPAFAQDQEPIPFAGGTLTIKENDDGEKILAFDSAEIHRDYVIYYNKQAEVAGKAVALFDAGPGGNACGPASIIVWKDDGGALKTQSVGEEECGAPPPALTGDAIYYVPYLMPGSSAPVRRWTPSEGLTVAGTLNFTPEPGTDWSAVDVTKIDHIMNAFSNEAVYKAATALLGPAMESVTTGLTVGSPPTVLPSGVFWATGCVPHACGVSDAFMAVDAKGKKLYFAQQKDNAAPETWPAETEWPGDVKDAMTKELAPQQ